MTFFPTSAAYLVLDSCSGDEKTLNGISTPLLLKVVSVCLKSDTIKQAKYVDMGTVSLKLTICPSCVSVTL